MSRIEKSEFKEFKTGAKELVRLSENIDQSNKLDFIHYTYDYSEKVYSLLQKHGLYNLDEGIDDDEFEIYASELLSLFEDCPTPLVLNHLKIQLGILLIEDELIDYRVKQNLLETDSLFIPQAFANQNNSIPKTKDNMFLCSVTDDLLNGVNHYTKDSRKFVARWAKLQMLHYEESLFRIIKYLSSDDYSFEESILIDMGNLDGDFFEMNVAQRNAKEYKTQMSILIDRFFTDELTLEYVARIIANEVSEFVGYIGFENEFKVRVLREILQSLMNSKSRKAQKLINTIGKQTLKTALKISNRK